MQCLWCGGVDSALASSEQGAKETAIPLDPSDPCSLATFDKAWTVSNHKGVGGAHDLKIEIPAEVFLTGFTVSTCASIAKLLNEPFRQVFSETAGVDEITPRLGDVKSRTRE